MGMDKYLWCKGCCDEDHDGEKLREKRIAPHERTSEINTNSKIHNIYCYIAQLHVAEICNNICCIFDSIHFHITEHNGGCHIVRVCKDFFWKVIAYVFVLKSTHSASPVRRMKSIFSSLAKYETMKKCAFERRIARCKKPPLMSWMTRAQPLFRMSPVVDIGILFPVRQYFLFILFN